MQLQLCFSTVISTIEKLYFCIPRFSKKIEVRKLNNDKEIGMNTTSVPLLGEIYSQLEQSVNTNAIERTTFLSIYFAMIAIIASIIKVKDPEFIVGRFEDIIKEYDVIFYIKMELDVEEDGFRSTDSEFHYKIDETIQNLMKKYKEDTVFVDLSGTVEERLDKIIKTLEILDIELSFPW